MIAIPNLLAIICLIVNLATAYILGRFVLKNQIPVFISRKVIHIIFFFMPFVLVRTVPRAWLPGFGIWLSIFAVLKLLLYTKFVRSRLGFFDTCFAALDRPEDRPYNLALLAAQKLTFILIINASVYLSPAMMRQPVFYSIAYLTLTFGDGLAEPVGRLVKSRKYKVFSLFNTKANYRSLAGSSCVYIAALFLVYFFYPDHRPEFVFQLLFIPLIATLLEAFSPKAMDAPFLFFGTFMSMHLVNYVYYN
jgi:phytol kinase